MYRIFLSILLASAAPAFAQDSTDGASSPAKFFSSEETMSVTISAPWKDFAKNKKKTDAYPAKLEYTDESGNARTLNVGVSRRGITRQRVCKFPPVKIHFDKEEVKGTTFRGQKNLKMVTHCGKGDKYEQYYVLEMLAYRMYNVITEKSFRVRPLKVTYVDTKTGKADDTHFAFLIEDDSDVAKRNDLKKLSVQKVKLSQLSTDIISDYSLFQLQIGNVDWAATAGPKDECCHNSKLIGPEPLQPGDKAYPVPYDFDSAGLVNAHYAAPNEGIGITRVTQRLYRGYCKFNSGLDAAREKSLSHEADMLALISNEDLLVDKTKKKAKSFLEKYYDMIRDNKTWQKKVIEKCRK
jgi:hypothetical protein